jgi:hypothetical protein
VAPGAEARFDETLYIGPKLQTQLEIISPRLDRVADYGMLTILAKPLFTALKWMHSATGNWGISIILVTFLLKLLFYPLSETSGRSMAKMKLLSPRIKNLQETYKDDREKLGRGESRHRLLADRHPDSGVFRVLPGAAGECGNAPGAVHALDPRPVLARSVLHSAGHHGRCHGGAVPPESSCDGPRAAEGVHDYAAGHVRDVRVLPGGTGAVLGDEHHSGDCAAVEYQPPHCSSVI